MKIDLKKKKQSKTLLLTYTPQATVTPNVAIVLEVGLIPIAVLSSELVNVRISVLLSPVKETVALPSPSTP